MFGASAIPLLLIMGGAVDLARFTRYKAELSNVVDGAALSLARKSEEFASECKDVGQACEGAQAFVSEYIDAYALTDTGHFEVGDIVVKRAEDGFDVSAEGAMRTIFLPLGDMSEAGQNIITMNMDIDSQVVEASNRVELALVLDNTGSMNCVNSVNATCAKDWASPDTSSRITALKTAAKTLVDTLMKDDMEEPDDVKIALVPFEGMVNVGLTSGPTTFTTPPSWIAWADQGKNKWEGANFDKNNFGGSIGSKAVGHSWLFKKLKVAWGGCVEMRTGTYELTDAAPSASIADSLYVPFFAPDEPDSTVTVGTGGSATTKYNNRSNGGSSGTNYSYLNDYLKEDKAYTTPALAQKSLVKYTQTTPTWHTGRKDVTAGPYEYGPNRGCPAPIIPLTNASGKATIKTAIDGMIAYWATGTFIPAGLVWGWHVLSPTEPFTQGVGPSTDPDKQEQFENTVKAIVLLSDGDNDVTDGGDNGSSTNHNKSRYSAYSYVATTPSTGGTEVRLGSSAANAATALDTKLPTLCTNVKNAGIRLYMISFGTLTEATKTMMSNCATVDNGDKLYYHAPTTADLQNIFYEIGEDLSDIHLSM